ncbi:rhomboid family intramembrane serine protease [Corynebacterium sp. H128]|uniref:rhomboid family intramembrane serine protease n=1 Tax=unclassified Corynebacterium TaxID=2624378 RepID=UPI00403F079E
MVSKGSQAARRGAASAGTFVAIIWVVHIINLLTGKNLTHFGVHPLDVSSLPYIFTSPFLHVGFPHLIANTLPAAIFVFLIAWSGHKVLWEVSLIVAIIGGIGTWLFGGIGTNHVGASGLIYGWLAYLIVRGMFNRSLGQVLLGVVLASLYGGLIWGVLPSDAGVSWQGHLFGGIGGIVAGATITSDDPLALVQKREKKRLQRGSI